MRNLTYLSLLVLAFLQYVQPVSADTLPCFESAMDAFDNAFIVLGKGYKMNVADWVSDVKNCPRLKEYKAELVKLRPLWNRYNYCEGGTLSYTFDHMMQDTEQFYEKLCGGISPESKRQLCKSEPTATIETRRETAPKNEYEVVIVANGCPFSVRFTYSSEHPGNKTQRVSTACVSPGTHIAARSSSTSMASLTALPQWERCD